MPWSRWSGTVHRLIEFDPGLASYLQPNKYTMRWEYPSFYEKFSILSVSVDTSTNSMLWRYADAKDGSTIMAVSGEKNLYQVNAVESLNLDRFSVPAYVRFFFDLCFHSPDSYLVVELPQEVLWWKDADDAFKDQVNSLIHPMKVTAINDSEYRVVLHLIGYRKLVKRKMVVKSDGNVKTVTDEVILEHLPVVEFMPC